MDDDVPVGDEGGVGGVLCGAAVGAALFVPALRKMGGAEAGNALHLAEKVVDDVTPVAEHVGDDPAAVLLAVVPGGALRRLEITLKNPITELAAHGKNPAEEAGVDEHPELDQAGQPELVLDHAVFQAGGAAFLGQREGGGGVESDGLFAID